MSDRPIEDIDPAEPIVFPEPIGPKEPPDDYFGPGFDDEDAPGVYLPSEEEIRRACQEIQDGWSKAEERLRRTGPAYRRLALYRVRKADAGPE